MHNIKSMNLFVKQDIEKRLSLSVKSNIALSLIHVQNSHTEVLYHSVFQHRARLSFQTSFNRVDKYRTKSHHCQV